MRTHYLITLCIAVLCSFNTCKNKLIDENKVTNVSKGKLFIIGGGRRPASMIQSLIQLAGVDKAGYVVVLPMASELIDTASYYSSKQFKDLGVEKVYAMNFQSKEDMSTTRLDSLKNASLIYITGGDQNLFMKKVLNTPVYTAIHQAFTNGAVIVGTSAGAAMMGKKMISGNEFKHPEYTGDYRTIEANNIEIVEGLGLDTSVIIDQHFVKRMRMNRLISTCLENPMETCFGIDESTAILLDGNKVTVYGESQVIVLKHVSAETHIVNGLLGGEKIELNVYLPGDSFTIEK